MTVVATLLVMAIPLAGVGAGAEGQSPARGGPDPAPGIAQLQYDGGGDWYANPSALPNLLAFIRERTGLEVPDAPRAVRLTDPALRSYPYLYMTGHGNVRFSAAELDALRRYLEAGGFLHADDNYGMDESFRRELARLYPDASLVDIPLDHPVYRVFFELPEGLPKVHEHDGEPARGLGLFRNGRLVVFYSYQSDLGDGWENAEAHGNAPSVREQALRMGVNLFVYALSQSAT